jgi:hypothetical protein
MKIKHPKLTYSKQPTPIKKTIIGGLLIATIVALLILFLGVLDRFEKPLTAEEELQKIEYLKQSLEQEIINSHNYRSLNGYDLKLINVLDERDRCKKENCYLFRYSYLIDTNKTALKINEIIIDLYVSDLVEDIDIINK